VEKDEKRRERRNGMEEERREEEDRIKIGGKDTWEDGKMREGKRGREGCGVRGVLSMQTLYFPR
jgi:hypothetical protein